jgi:hypothetical protein
MLLPIFDLSKTDTMNYTIQQDHIGNLRAGDTIMHNGEMKTVSGNNIKRDSFMGTSVFGDTYNHGHKPIEKINFTKP